MPSLIVFLPVLSRDAHAGASGLAPSVAAQELDYVVQGDDLQILSHGRALPSMLPAASRGTRVIAVVPARAVSWHRVALPDKVVADLLAGRMDAARARAVLGGAMEEQLLDEPQHLHFAVFPAPATGATGGALWVAVCDRAWLRSVLGVLEAAGYVALRVVPECEPLDAQDNALALVSSALAPAQVCVCSAAGVAVLPFGALAGLLHSHSGVEVLAEPSLMGLVEQSLGGVVQAHSVEQSMVRAAQSVRNLGQWEFSPSKSGRAAKRFADAWHTFWHSRVWRPVRWGLLALAATQLVAINAMAYRQQALLVQRQAGIESVLRQTFPEVTVVVDPALQMQRAVDALAQSRGGGTLDVARVLTALSEGPLAAQGLSAIELQSDQLAIKGGGLSDADTEALNTALGMQGWVARLQGEQITVQRKEAN